MRIAFLTPEFVTDYRDGGGLGNYLHRICRLLVDAGHEVELFVASNMKPEVFQHEGIRVERVMPSSFKWTHQFLRKVAWLAGLSHPVALHAQARALARALESRHQFSPFDFVQSADYLGVGLKVKGCRGRTHLVRCSSAADLYNAADGRGHRAARWRERFERKAIRHADKAYAPSYFVAEHYRRQHHIPVEVLRPPLAMEVALSGEVPCGLPGRYLLHFGQLTVRKGTHWIIKALRLAFEMEPSLRMVWIGRGKFETVGAWLETLGAHRSKLLVLYPMPKPELYSILQRAEATVLPSLVDNLPNTVIESLMLGIPVIGTRGASIDELVKDGVTGVLVAPSDVAALAEAMVRVWRKQSTARKGFIWNESITQEMQPQQAIQNLLRFSRADFRPSAESLHSDGAETSIVPCGRRMPEEFHVL